MPTEQARPGMFARSGRGPTPIRNTGPDSHNGGPAAQPHRKLTKTSPHHTGNPDIQPSTRLTHDPEQVFQTSRPAISQDAGPAPGRTFGQALALMSDGEIMDILLDTVNYLIKLRPNSPLSGYYEMSTGRLVNLDDTEAIVWRVMNPDPPDSTGSERSLTPEHPLISEVEAVQAHPIKFTAKDLEKLHAGVDARQTPAAQPTVSSAGNPQGPPSIIVSSDETTNASNRPQRCEPPEPKDVTPERSSPPRPVKSENQPAHSARRTASPAPHNPIAPSSDSYLTVPLPGMHRLNSPSPHSVSGERRLPQRPTTAAAAAAQQGQKPSNMHDTSARPYPSAPVSNANLTIPVPNAHQPEPTNARPAPNGRRLPYPDSLTAQQAPKASKPQGLPYPDDTEYITGYVADSMGGCAPS